MAMLALAAAHTAPPLSLAQQAAAPLRAPGGGIELRGPLSDAPPPAPPGPPKAVPPARGSASSAPAAQPDQSTGVVTLIGLLTADGQPIDSGLVWRVYQRSGDGNVLVLTNRTARPTLQLPAGDYLVNVGFGRAHLSRKITVKGASRVNETFVINAGALRLSALTGNRTPAPSNSVTYEVQSDERDQSGNRTTIVAGVKPGLVLRLNSGIYHIVSTFGDANAVARADVTVEAGKLTEVTATHPSARVTLKLVTRQGGEAIPDTQWQLSLPGGEIVKESVGALPTHIVAPGTYRLLARSRGQRYERQFTVRDGDMVQVEVVVQ